ncbi:MAG TPA: toll/interleukin-1 receptor domain-containing protein [bacterium]|nr:toll/interleukin-1 receptor domain-containing protein [bacterium]HOY64127.1 toll/interleukin-1 receptor domain-containing protein [bacterium]
MVYRRDDDINLELPKRLENILAQLSVYYEKNSNPEMQSIIVNSRYRVHEVWNYDNWNGGTYGHAIYFQVPSTIFYRIFDERDVIAEELRKRINEISNVQNESIDAVFIELQEDQILENWREKSGLIISQSAVLVDLTEDESKRLWKPDYFRLFISHKDEYKSEATKLSKALEFYGISCFVAHENIHPIEEWQHEIEKALFSMDAFMALLTDNFPNSQWTDQEIGIAIGRRTPIVPVRLGIDPYGFIGKYQGLKGKDISPHRLANQIFNTLIEKRYLKDRLFESLAVRLENPVSYKHATFLMGYLEKMPYASPQTIERLEKAPENTGQLDTVKGRLSALVMRLRRSIAESDNKE